MVSSSSSVFVGFTAIFMKNIGSFILVTFTNNNTRLYTFEYKTPLKS